MLEVRYNTITNLITGWWGSRFGNHEVKLEGRPCEAIVELDIAIPFDSPESYLYDPLTNTLVSNPDYSQPLDYTARATELLESSPSVITQPEQWELLRIIGRQFGWYPWSDATP